VKSAAYFYKSLSNACKSPYPQLRNHPPLKPKCITFHSQGIIFTLGVVVIILRKFSFFLIFGGVIIVLRRKALKFGKERIMLQTYNSSLAASLEESRRSGMAYTPDVRLICRIVIIAPLLVILPGKGICNPNVNDSWEEANLLPDRDTDFCRKLGEGLKQ
jgi:hypothetical protein